MWLATALLCGTAWVAVDFDLLEHQYDHAPDQPYIPGGGAAGVAVGAVAGVGEVEAAMVSAAGGSAASASGAGAAAGAGAGADGVVGVQGREGSDGG